MKVQIEVSSETAEILKANAAARKLSLSDYVRALAEADARGAVTPKSSVDEFDRDMDELAAGLEGLPILPRDFSRADIYDEHN